jgi:anti-sigma factor RsiW
MARSRKQRHDPSLASFERHLDVARDASNSRLRDELASLKKKYDASLKQLDAEKAAVANLTALANVKPKKISRARAAGKRPEATAVLVCSDWHVEERVDPATNVPGNEYTLDIADRRIKQLVQKAAMLIEHEKSLTGIRRIVVAALGDMITGQIHDDLVEMTQLAPLAATRWAGERLGGVIDAMSEIAPVLVTTSSGNHGRTTHKPRIATENEHSFEQHLYLTMAASEHRPNVEWQVGKGYLNIADLDGFLVRFHHGHAIRFGGGVGGLTIPANKAIANWNISRRVHLDVFGHWHCFSWLPYRFVANGCLIGHNAFADRIKAEFQPPSQSLIIVDHDHNRVTKVLPIFVQ